MLISDLIPYRDIWFNCVSNLKLSVLQTLHKEYVNVAWDNNYIYKRRLITEACHKDFNVITNWTEFKLGDSLFVNTKTVSYDTDAELIEKIKALLIQNKFVFVDVDLYYWNKENLCYRRNHWYHNTIVQRFDEETNCFWVLDLSKGEIYGCYAVPLDDFVRAIRECHLDKEKVVFCDLNSKISVLNITSSLLKKNTESIIKDIEKVEQFTYFDMHDEDFKEKVYLDYNYSCLTQFVQRQKANIVMLQGIGETGAFDKDQSEKMIEICKSNVHEWDVVRNIVYKTYYSDNHQRDITNVNKRIKKALSTEKNMWEKFLILNSKVGNDYVYCDFHSTALLGDE